MYCPECSYEYIDGIEMCSDCGVKLVEEPVTEDIEPEEPGEPEPEFVPKEPMVQIRNYPGLGLGAIIKDFLIDNGIPAILLGGGVMPEERICVPEHLAAKADELINKFEEEAAEREEENPDDEEYKSNTILGKYREDAKKGKYPFKRW